MQCGHTLRTRDREELGHETIGGWGSEHQNGCSIKSSLEPAPKSSCLELHRLLQQASPGHKATWRHRSAGSLQVGRRRLWLLPYPRLVNHTQEHTVGICRGAGAAHERLFGPRGCAHCTEEEHKFWSDMVKPDCSVLWVSRPYHRWVWAKLGTALYVWWMGNAVRVWDWAWL